MTQKYTFSVSKTITGTVDVYAETKEEAEKIIGEEITDEDVIELNQNDEPMGLSKWKVNDLISIEK